jgi:hypothetical protein
MSDQDLSHCSVPLETEDGDEVVICQENVGADNMVGGGEWKDAELGRSVEDAAAEQLEREREAPTGAPANQGGHRTGAERAARNADEESPA